MALIVLSVTYASLLFSIDRHDHGTILDEIFITRRIHTIFVNYKTRSELLDIFIRRKHNLNLLLHRNSKRSIRTIVNTSAS